MSQVKTASTLLNLGVTAKPSARAITRALLLAEESYALVLLFLTLDTYPPVSEDDRGALDWTPETLRRQLEQDFALQLPKYTLDKIMAAISVLTSNRFYKDVRTFIDTCNIFAGGDFDPTEFDPADAGEVLWGVTEACLIYPPNDDPEDTEFSDEIRGYIGKVLHAEGIADPPDVLRLGLRGDVAERIRSEYADDPEMYGAIWKEQQGKQTDLRDMLRRNIAEMTLQLKLLPLNNGTTQDVVARLEQLSQNLPEGETSGNLA
jgi:hypothetical protein